MSSDLNQSYEELDSFTENIIRRTQERQKLLNDETNNLFSDELSPNLSSNQSQSSLNSSVLLNDSKSNIKLNESLNESQNESIVEPIVDSTSKQLIENLSKLSPNRKRVPLNQRLNTIARTYNYEDSENIEFIDDCDTYEESRPKNQFRSPTKSMRPTATPIESPPKKRPLLNERLNQIARTYDSSDDFVQNAVQTKLNKEILTQNRSPTKKLIIKRNVDIEEKPKEPKTNSKSPSKSMTRSPVKKQTNSAEKRSSETSTPIQNKSPLKSSPVKKQIENNDLKEKLSQFGFQQTERQTEPSVKPKSIYNSRDNKRELQVINSPNVSAVRKQFEQNCQSETKVETPEILPLKAKTDLFEKAILAENEAKSKQYHRKRNAPQIKPVVKEQHNLVINKVVNTSEETAIKRQKSSENMIQTKTNVANNILLRRQELEKKLLFGSGSETTTAKAYNKELENRQKEIELLKRPFNRIESEKQTFNQKVEEFHEEVEEKLENFESPQNEFNQSVDDETAHQTVCEAFEEIENYSNEQSDDSIEDNLNYGFSSMKSDSKLINEKQLNIESKSPTKNRLYPQLFAESEERYVQNYDPDMNPPPEKPPRVYDLSVAPNTTIASPMRTISFYRREKQNQYNGSNTPSAPTVLPSIVEQTMDANHLVERNHKIQEQIDELNEKVQETNRIAGQASTALNLCLEREEFKSSEERVEAEKVLLLSGQRRIAALNEIQRLKIKLSDKKPEPQQSKGQLTLSDFKLKLKVEFLVSRTKGMSEIHHLICLVNNGSNVRPTNLLNTEKDIKNGFLEFDYGFRDLNELSADFQIVVHIYNLVTIKHQMSHEIKYHIKSLTKRTPKKNKSTMKSPSVRSPGGPNAVMSTSFRLVGAVTINLKNYHQNSFRLDNFDFNCPLEGTLNVKTKLNVRHPFYKEGFFDVRDNSNFWNLRWALLNGTNLSFWRSPEDVNKKPALNVVDLKSCINPKITLIPLKLRHICARNNTIAVITVDNSNASKNIFTKGGSIPRSRPIKTLISGENKEKCIEWSEYMSRALSNIRNWDMDAVRPYSEEEFEKLLVGLP